MAKTSPYKSGKTFEKEIDESCRTFVATCSGGGWQWRIPDSVSYGAKNSDDARHKVIADHVLLYRGTFYAIEDKSSTSEKGYLLRYIRPHQLHGLLDIEASGGKGIFLLAKRNPDNATENVWAVSASKMKEFFDKDYKRIDWKEFGTPLPIKRRRIRITVEMGAVVQ